MRKKHSNISPVLVKPNSFEKWIREFRICDKTEYEKVIKPETKPDKGELRMGEVVSLISELTKGEAIIVTDVGQNQMYAARYYKFKHPNTFVTSGGMGTMGFGLPAGIGAKLAGLTSRLSLLSVMADSR